MLSTSLQREGHRIFINITAQKSPFLIVLAGCQAGAEGPVVAHDDKRQVIEEDKSK